MAVVASSSLATSVVRWHHHHQHHHPLLFISPSIPHRHRCRQSLAAQPIRAFGRSDLDGFARRVASGEALRDAWRTANDGIELLAFEARRAAERIDRRFSVSGRFDSLARAASVRAREIDQELGIGRRWRSFSLDFSRNWPRYRKDLSDFLETPLGRGFAVARLFPVTRYFDKQKLNTRGIVKAYVTEEKSFQQQETFEKLSLPPHVSHWIVRSYLLHYAYQDTLNSYDITSESMYPLIPKVQGNGFSEQTDVYALNHRKILRELIKNGDIDSAFEKIQEWYPQMVQDDASVVCFLLHSQRFIEYIRVGNLEDAITYAQAQLAKYFNVRPFSELLGDVVALLAFGEPLESCVGYLLNTSQREFVADAVNAVVLSTNPDLEDAENCMQTCLEKLLRQLTLCSLEYRALTGDQGEPFFLHRELGTSAMGERS